MMTHHNGMPPPFGGLKIIFLDKQYTYTYTDDLQEPRTVEYISGVPDEYRMPFLAPLYYADDLSGIIPMHMRAFIEWAADGGNPPEGETIVVIRDYLVHYILAPCWDRGIDDEMLNALAELRRNVFNIKTGDDVKAWIDLALKISLDPL